MHGLVCFGSTSPIHPIIIIIHARTGTGERAVQQALQRHFAPEFLNRLDRTVLFAPLDKASLGAILHQHLARATQRQGLRERGINVTLSTAATDLLVAEGADPAYGARPLRRLVEDTVLTELSLLVVSGYIADNTEV